MNKKVVVIGGVAGGASAAAMLRRLEKETEIVILEKGDFISYANCGLPYYLGGLAEQEALIVLTPEDMSKQHGVEVRTQNEALRIDRRRKAVLVRDHRAGREYWESYDKLVIATGAVPRQADVPGAGLPNVFTLWTMADFLTVKKYIGENAVKRAVIAGGGFVSLEVAENLTRLGIGVTVIQSPAQLLNQLDADMAPPLQEHVSEKGVALLLGDRVVEIADREGVTAVKTKNGLSVETDMVILAVGVAPNSALAAEAGLETGVKGGIVTDEHMRTSDPDIYAAGDVVQVMDFVSKTPAVVPLAGPANRQGRIAAENIAGKATRYIGTQGSFIVKAFEMTTASTGMSEKTLNRLGKAAGTDYAVIRLDSPNHARYYPGAETMHLKVIFSLPEGKLLGAQAVGGAGVDKRIDVLSTVIHYDGRVSDLRDLELAYAPQFSTPKDGLNIIGYMSEKYLP